MKNSSKVPKFKSSKVTIYAGYKKCNDNMLVAQLSKAGFYIKPR
jgi:hypothetical protein